MAYSEKTFSLTPQNQIQKIFFLSEPPPGQRHACRVVPDGCTDLTFEVVRGQVTPYIFGTSTVAYEFETKTDAAYFGFRFRAGTLPRFDDYDSSDLIDSHVKLDHQAELRSLGEQFWEVREDWNAVAALAQKRLNPKAAEADSLSQILKVLLENDGCVELAEVFDQANKSTRQIERTFQSAVGLSPKKLCRILRFQKALKLIESSDSLAAVALDCGYYDQSHMIREFKELLGQSPTAYLPPSLFHSNSI